VNLRSPVSQTVPQFADGAGWRTTVVLVNTTDAAITGELKVYDSAGQPLQVALNGSTNSTFAYSIPSRSGSVFQSGAALGSSLRVGSVQVIPSGSTVGPSAFATTRYAPDVLRTTEATVSAVTPDAQWRMFAESSGLIQTGVAIANPASNAVNVQYQLIPSNATVANQSGSISIPANGQVAFFVNQLPGIGSSSGAFQGTLRIEASGAGSSGVAVMGLRTRINERGDFLITTTDAVRELVTPSGSELFIPYFAMGAGYGVQFVLFSRSASPVDGTVSFFDRQGRFLNVFFQSQ
jgi:hypothetical protein